MSAILDYNSVFTTAFPVALASRSALFRTESTFFAKIRCVYWMRLETKKEAH
jgi:hypothetical protein